MPSPLSPIAASIRATLGKASLSTSAILLPIHPSTACACRGASSAATQPHSSSHCGGADSDEAVAAAPRRLLLPSPAKKKNLARRVIRQRSNPHPLLQPPPTQARSHTIDASLATALVAAAARWLSLLVAAMQMADVGAPERAS
ncbi:hypothetical protein MRX96_024455 [Rhipicephalus microplus]